MDRRLTALAKGPSELHTTVSGSDQPLTVVRGSEAIATYTRYADDLTFSFPGDHPGSIHRLLWFVRKIVEDEGYELHIKKKLHIRRRHDRQQVTGLVVNERINLPRAVRRPAVDPGHRQRIFRDVHEAPQRGRVAHAEVEPPGPRLPARDNTCDRFRHP